MDKKVLAILNKIESSNNSAYIVGGAVRDFILKRKIHDYDITTSLNPKEILKIFPSGIMVNKKMGTVTVSGVEITPYRLESKYEDARRPAKVFFSRNIKDDLCRRDFTINAIAMDSCGRFVDMFGGMDDINKRVIRTVNNPDKRFREDSLRMMRAIRFACQLNFKIEKRTFYSIRKNRELIKRISTERIRDEFDKILLSDNVVYGMNLLRSSGILEIIIPEYKLTYDYDQLNNHHKYDLYNHMIRVIKYSNKDLSTRLAALLHDIEKPSTREIFDDGVAHYYGHDIESAKTARKILHRLKYSNSIVDESSNFIKNHMTVDPNIGIKGIRKLKQRIGDGIYNFLSFVRADSISASGDSIEKIDKILKMLDNIDKESLNLYNKHIDINGGDLIKLGFDEGPNIGKLLKRFSEMRDFGMPDDKNVYLKLAKDFLNGGNMKKYFGTDGVRGIANTELTNEFAYRLGRAIGQYLDGNKKVLVGMDTRLSSPMFMCSITAGLIAEGVNVDELGIISTPGVAYLTRMHGYGMGVMISASHNPYIYNGIKLIGADGFKLSDDQEIAIENICDNLGKETLDGDKIGKFNNAEKLINDYMVHLERLTEKGFKGLKIAIDAGNGVMSNIAPKVFEELGAKVISINCEGNGRYINDNTGSTCPEVVARLTKENVCDIGIAFDGDADRVIFSDENGNVLDGDHIIAYAAKKLKADGMLNNGGVVTTSMSNGAFEKHLNENDIKLFRADVGDKYVMEAMRQNGYILGGEQSGHIIFLEHLTMGDGLQTAILIVDMLQRSGEKSSVIGKQYTDYPQVLINANASDNLKKTYKENKNIQDAISKLIDENPDFRIIIRPSGTEKFVRIMIEGMDAEKILNEANNLKKIIEEEDK